MLAGNSGTRSVKRLNISCVRELWRRRIGPSSLIKTRNSASGFSLAVPSRVGEAEPKKSIKSFQSELRERKDEARRSSLIRVNSEKSIDDLLNVCSQYGKLKRALFISSYDKSSVLVEYESHEGFEALSKAAVFPTTSSPVMALPSHFLWLLGGSKSQTGKSEPKAPSLPIEKFFVPSEVELRERLKPLQMSEQIKELFQYTRLTEAGVRLKYMIACQLEDILSSSFMPLCSVAPFGSSVNGFGKHGCDTDIVIRPTSVEEFGDPQSRLVFETKAVPGNQRLQTQLYLELIGDLLANHVPGCSNIIRILQARVPIVRFNHDLAGTQCDISMDPMGHRMSELLWLCTQVDPRVAPLVFAVRRWAQGVQLTNPAPGRWISNFSLTLLVIFFLQSTSPSILPRLHTLANWAASGQVYSLDNKEDTNESSLGELLHYFFAFVRGFDFHNKAMSVLHADTMTKPDYAALYLENPLERHANVSRNVSLEEVQRLQEEAGVALWKLETKHGILFHQLCEKSYNETSGAYSSTHMRKLVYNLQNRMTEDRRVNKRQSKGRYR